MLDSYDEPIFFEDLEAASKCVSEIVKRDVDPTVEFIIQVLDGYLEEHDGYLVFLPRKTGDR